MGASLVLSLCASWSAAGLAEDQPEWLLVRGTSELPGRLSYEKIARSYLRRSAWRIVESADGAKSPATSRMVVGTPKDNPLVRALAGDLGLRVLDDRLEFRGHRLPAGTGLVLLTEDPDGRGDLALFTGIDGDGVFSGFTVRVDMSRRGFLITRRNEVVLRGAEHGFDTQRPEVVRLDRYFDLLRESAGDKPAANVALHLARGLGGFRFVYQAAVGPDVELLPFMKELLRTAPERIEGARKASARRDLSEEILRLSARSIEALAKRDGPQPVYYVLYGAPTGTNAKAFGFDPITGRPQVLLNLLRLPDRDAFEVAVIHETVHTLQSGAGRRLLDRAVQEGVATCITQVLRPSTEDTAALMWSEKDLRAARRHHEEILAEFTRMSDSRDAGVHREFLQAGATLSRVAGAPSRSGYYVGWLAARAWSKKNPRKGPRGLLAATADEIFKALD